MTAAAGVDWGSVADWVSGVGSIGASVLALWLSGADRRARREAERPVVSCSVTGSTDGWVSLTVGFDNPSSKQWRCTAATVVAPKDGMVVKDSDTLREVDVTEHVFDAATRDRNAKRTIPIGVSIGAIGSAAPSWQGGGRGNYAWTRLQTRHGGAKLFRLRLDIESLDPTPDRFHVVITRTVDR